MLSLTCRGRREDDDEDEDEEETEDNEPEDDDDEEEDGDNGYSVRGFIRLEGPQRGSCKALVSLLKMDTEIASRSGVQLQRV